MEKIKSWAKNEFFVGYTLFEKVFMIALIVMQIGVFIIVPDSILGIVSGISGAISVVLCAKGKISFYYIGFVQTITYMILAWQNRFYGEVAENVFYLVTMVIGVIMWNKHITKSKDEGNQVEVKALTIQQWIIIGITTIICTIVTGLILTKIGNAQPYTDATTNVLAIFAQIMMIKRYREQWLWWIIINLICIKMWFVAGNWSMVVMYIGWTANCVYGWYNWTKLNKKKIKEPKI